MSKTNGHEFDATVDGECRKSERIDRRLRNPALRTNMRNRVGLRSDLRRGEVLSGTKYGDYLKCVACHTWLPRAEFRNYAVSAKLRANNGCNVRCRGCNRNQYACGYKVDDAFVVVGRDADVAKEDDCRDNSDESEFESNLSESENETESNLSESENETESNLSEEDDDGFISDGTPEETPDEPDEEATWTSSDSDEDSDWSESSTDDDDVIYADDVTDEEDDY